MEKAQAGQTVFFFWNSAIALPCFSSGSADGCFLQHRRPTTKLQWKIDWNAELILLITGGGFFEVGGFEVSSRRIRAFPPRERFSFFLRVRTPRVRALVFSPHAAEMWTFHVIESWVAFSLPFLFFFFYFLARGTGVVMSHRRHRTSCPGTRAP